MIEVLAVDCAFILMFGFFDEERTLEQDLAACAASRAVAFAAGEKFLVFVGIDVGANKPSHLADGLTHTKLKQRLLQNGNSETD